MGKEVTDVDGNTESRSGTISVFNGPSPVIKTFVTEAEEIDGVRTWLIERRDEGVALHEIAIFV